MKWSVVMDDKVLHLGIKELRRYIKKTKPKYHYVRGFEDMKSIMLETIDELEYRSKYMDDKMIKFREKG